MEALRAALLQRPARTPLAIPLIAASRSAPPHPTPRNRPPSLLEARCPPRPHKPPRALGPAGGAVTLVGAVGECRAFERRAAVGATARAYTDSSTTAPLRQIPCSLSFSSSPQLPRDPVRVKAGAKNEAARRLGKVADLHRASLIEISCAARPLAATRVRHFRAPARRRCRIQRSSLPIARLIAACSMARPYARPRAARRSFSSATLPRVRKLLRDLGIEVGPARSADRPRTRPPSASSAIGGLRCISSDAGSHGRTEQRARASWGGRARAITGRALERLCTLLRLTLDPEALSSTLTSLTWREYRATGTRSPRPEPSDRRGRSRSPRRQPRFWFRRILQAAGTPQGVLVATELLRQEFRPLCCSWPLGPRSRPAPPRASSFRAALAHLSSRKATRARSGRDPLDSASTSFRVRCARAIERDRFNSCAPR